MPLAETVNIMDRIYREQPEFWPHGLTVGHHTDGLYTIRDKNSSKPVGFVGFQVFRKQAKKVGYYTIGILPEYRRKGYAKAALQALVREKAGAVDDIRAYIMSHNGPSLALAHKAGIPIEIMKKAFVDPGMAMPIAGQFAAGLMPDLPEGGNPLPEVDLKIMMRNFRQTLRRNPEQALAATTILPLLALKMRKDNQAEEDTHRHLDRLTALSPMDQSKQANFFEAFSDPDHKGPSSRVGESIGNFGRGVSQVGSIAGRDPRTPTFLRNARDTSLAGLALMLASRGKLKAGLGTMAAVPVAQGIDRFIDRDRGDYGTHAVEAFTSGNPEDTAALSDKAINSLTRPGWQQWMVDHPTATLAGAAALPIGAYWMYRNYRRRKEQERQRQELMALHQAYAQNQGANVYPPPMPYGGGGGGFPGLELRVGGPMLGMSQGYGGGYPMGLPMKYASSKQAAKVPWWKILARVAAFDLATQGGHNSLLKGEGWDSIAKAYTDPESYTPLRGVNTAINAFIAKTPSIGKAFGGMAIKDIAMNALPLPAAVGHAAEEHQKLPKMLLAGLLGGGVLAGAGAALSRPGADASDLDNGRIRVTLPTRDPDDVETSIDMPFSPRAVNLSNNVQTKLVRDIQRRLRGEVRERTQHRRPLRLPQPSSDLAIAS